MFGSLGAADGVYPAYHMNKLHWISALLPDAPDEGAQFLVNVRFEATKDKRKRQQNSSTGYFSQDILFLFLQSHLIF